MVAMTEADTRAKLIDPAIHSRGWVEELIKREETAGTIDIIDGKPRRRNKGRMDYTLRVKVTSDSHPVAIALIEAKKNTLPPDHGLEQAKLYAECRRFNIPFIFSSNGYQFVEFDKFTGITSSPKPMAEFPTPDELRARYEAGMGFSLASPQASPLLTRYARGDASRRYYQDAAIRAVLEKVASGHNRALLSLATGTGKTRIAINLLKRISDAGQLRKALFICDRDELRTQAFSAFNTLFGADAAIAEGGSPQKNARVIIATYQTLGVDSETSDSSFLTKHYPENYFSHIVIDECHRSAWGKWSQVLLRNSEAVQVGLTATPRKLDIRENSREAKEDLKISADNLAYFGEPVYEYTIEQAMADGYLAACEIIKGRVNIDDTGISVEDILAREPVDAITGQYLAREELKELYGKHDYETLLQLPDRVGAMTRDLFNYLIQTGGPEQKTIIFCARDTHADAVATEMNNLYAEWCQNEGKAPSPHYAFKCTGSNDGNDLLPDFRSSTRDYFIATTVDLLTTGVDVPALENVVFFKYVRSPITFYQMVGRGTRINESTGKLMFRVYDYTDATRLFGEEFITQVTPPRKPKDDDGPGRKNPSTIVKVGGFDVWVNDAGRYILDPSTGQPITVDEYKQKLAASLVEEAPTLEEFRKKWISPSERQELLERLPSGKTSAVLVQQLENMIDYDLYDVLADLGYGMSPKRRSDRAEAFKDKCKTWLEQFPDRALATIHAIVSQFVRGGTESLESREIFSTPEVRNAGGLAALKEVAKPGEVLQETKERMFAA